MKKTLLLSLLSLLYLNILLAQNTPNDSIIELKEVNVTYKATQLSPISYQDITLKAIKRNSIGQEPSLFLINTPSITAYTDAGHTQGYSYFRLRGIDQTRINITLDGVPLNDPLDQAFYFSNFADILNSVSKIQIQRGVGTTKNGTASYAGSIELFSPLLTNEQKIETGIGYGSYNTLRSFITFNSGIKNKKGLYIRVSQINSDGFKKHSSNTSKSVFLSSGLFLDKSIWKFNILAGKQKNNLAWMPVLEVELNCDRTENGNSTFENDDFLQSIFQIQNTYSINKYNTIQSSIYYTLVDGWWDFDLDNYYGITNDLGENVFRNTINSHIIGAFSNYSWKKNDLKLTTGLHTNIYNNKFTESHALSGDIWDQVYRYKDEISVFQKIEYTFKKILLFGDLQVRQTIFDYEGNLKFRKIDWVFLNPKLGISFQILNQGNLYLNIGRTGREPTKYDMFNGNDILLYSAPTDTNDNFILPESGNDLISSIDPEYVTDFEAGIRKNYENGKFNLNYYYLNFNNERVLNGSYGPSGLALTSEVEKSIRTGVEFFGEININRNIKLINNSSFNHSIITQQNIEFKPILTPKVIINQECVYSRKNLNLSLSLRYQGESYMNFENSEHLDDYILLNGRIDYKIRNYLISIFINNITDNYYFNQGVVNPDGSKSYFVQTPRNIYFSLRKDF